MKAADYAELAMLSATLDDVEGIRTAAANRLRILVAPGDEPDSDGICRGFGLLPDAPAVVAQAAALESLAATEHRTIRDLQRTLRRHPLGAWVKSTVGVGEKQGARLIAAVGDPYWNTLHDRPRTVSELWAYCGYHVLPAGGLATLDTHVPDALGGGTTSDSAAERVSTPNVRAPQGRSKLPSEAKEVPTSSCSAPRSGTSSDPAAKRATAPKAAPPQGRRKLPSEAIDDATPNRAAPCSGSTSAGGDTHGALDTHATPGVAPRRTKGQKSNWSTNAKTRTYLVAESCIKQAHSPYRFIYDQARKHYAEAVHAAACARCGPSGKPAQPGSPLSAGHQHARAMRKVSKEILKDLWRESRRLHGVTDAD